MCLALVSFANGTDDFVIAGVLPGISRDLNVTEAAAGQLVSIFSITYALGAPVMALFTARLPRRTVLIMGMAVFALTNLGAALAPSYPVMMVFRVLTALAGASVTPAAFATAASLASPARTGHHVGVVASGLTLALVFGVPVGTWLGGTFGWRSTMVFLVALSSAVVIGMLVFLPRLPAAPTLSLRQRLSPLGHRPVLMGLLGTVVGTASGLMTYTYIAPITHDLAGAGPRQLAVLIAVVGIAGMVGAFLGGRAADSWGPERPLMAALIIQTMATIALAGLASIRQGLTPLMVIGLVFTCRSIGSWALNPPLQMRLMNRAGAAGTEVVALNASGIYLGVFLGGVIGGAVLNSLGGMGVLLAAAAADLVAIGLFVVSFAVDGKPRPKTAVDTELMDKSG